MGLNVQNNGVALVAVREAAPEIERIEDLPKEFGVLLLTLGVLGLVLPGPMGTPALVAGGLVLWPGTFGRFSRWMERRYPRFQRAGNRQIVRFVGDLDRRYPRTPA